MTDPRQLSVYDGQDRLGMVIKHDGRCDAFDIHVLLGTFQKIKAAAAAVTLSAVRSCVADTSARKDNSDG
jgi:hypothetical protein